MKRFVLFGAFAILAPASEVQARDAVLKEERKPEVQAIAQAHYQNLLKTWRALEIVGISRDNPAVALSCSLSSAAAPARFPERRAQPGVFSQLQAQLSGRVSQCLEHMTFTPESLRQVQDQFIGLFASNSEDAYCDTEADCAGAWIELGGREKSEPIAAVSSELVDGIFFLCLRRYLPGLMAQLHSSTGKDADRRGRFLMTDAPTVCLSHRCGVFPRPAR